MIYQKQEEYRICKKLKKIRNSALQTTGNMLKSTIVIYLSLLFVQAKGQKVHKEVKKHEQV